VLGASTVTTTAFRGSIIADQSVTLTTGATITCGRAIALVGAVTMDTNVITSDCLAANVTVTPEPSTLALLLGPAVLGLATVARRRRSASTHPSAVLDPA
jgi:MYXO-CTERM domain-containing protein